MFDTSLVRSRAIAAPRFGLLAVSIAVHSIAIIAALALTVVSTELPTRSPSQMEIYRPVVIPTVPPAYGHPAQRRPSPTIPAPVPVQLPAGTAPNVIPDQTPVVGPATTASTSEPGTGTEGGPIGVPWGDPNSVNAADASQPVVEPQPATTYTPGGDVKQARVLRRVEPRYPTIMLSSRIAAIVTVHCIIDRNGNIRDPEIVRSSFPPFNEAVLDAVRQWTFIPGTLRGQPVDTYFELTVRFAVQ